MSRLQFELGELKARLINEPREVGAWPSAAKAAFGRPLNGSAEAELFQIIYEMASDLSREWIQASCADCSDWLRNETENYDSDLREATPQCVVIWLQKKDRRKGKVAEGGWSMANTSAKPIDVSQFSAEQLRSAITTFVPENATHGEKVAAIENGLRTVAGRSLRDAMAKWIVDEIVPVSRLVPESYTKWRPPVRDAMTFVVARLSPSSLAPKLLEQLELPRNTSPEARLLRLIAKVPGLQKLGQVIARNQHLRPALRNALARLENGIRDVSAEEVRSIIKKDLGSRLEKFRVKISPRILEELANPEDLVPEFLRIEDTLANVKNALAFHRLSENQRHQYDRAYAELEVLIEGVSTATNAERVAS